MTEIRFYHLQRQTIEQALPALLSKVVEAGFRALVKCTDRAMMDTLDKVLWDFDPSSFLPHDKDGSKHPKMQQVFLTLDDVNHNSANVLVLLDAVTSSGYLDYDRCLYMFDGNNEQTVTTARADWKRFKAEVENISYWQQRDAGGWEQKA